MEARTDNERAASLLEKIKPRLLRLLNESPAYGSIGIDLVFHNGEIARTVCRVEVSQKTRGGAA
ncbi:MAG: hypothetical protein LBU85_12970 [Treponema sp.]|jgi:hypothetical protein|nr:hypothetical protein [Treponema sp.]